jgi:hypothetical protein
VVRCAPPVTQPETSECKGWWGEVVCCCCCSPHLLLTQHKHTVTRAPPPPFPLPSPPSHLTQLCDLLIQPPRVLKPFPLGILVRTRLPQRRRPGHEPLDAVAEAAVLERVPVVLWRSGCEIWGKSLIEEKGRGED